MRITANMLQALRRIHDGGIWFDPATDTVRYQTQTRVAIHATTYAALVRNGLVEGRPGTWELQATLDGLRVIRETARRE